MLRATLRRLFPAPTGLRVMAVLGPGVGFALGALFTLWVLDGRRPSVPGAPPPPAYGVLLMAHGGTPQWNQAVLDAVEPLRADHPVEVAFGMADAASLQQAVARLEQAGTTRIGVVRLFISGESWFARTREILGLEPGAPPRHGEAGEHAAPPGAAAAPAHGGHRMEYWRIDTRASFAVSVEGLSQEPAMGTVLAERASHLSTKPAEEDVLVLAHGPGDDAENERWLARTGELAQAIRAARTFRRVEVMTLREDWPEKRARAEAEIRAFVERAQAESGRAIVLPFRVHGFGPYAEVLKGLDYVSDGRGLLPHAAVGQWIRRQAEALRAGRFEAPGPAGATVASGKPRYAAGSR
jgi:sirohydrochlorin cobaltochelatase